MKFNSRIAGLNAKLANSNTIDITLSLKSGVHLNQTINLLSSPDMQKTTSIVTWINDVLANVLIDLNASQQKEIDKIILELSAIHNYETNNNLTFALSKMLAKSVSLDQEIPFSEYLSHITKIKLDQEKNQSNALVPLVVNPMSGGFATFDLLTPRGTTHQETFSTFSSVKSELMNVLNQNRINFNLSNQLNAVILNENIENSLIFELLLNIFDQLKLLYNHDVFLSIDGQNISIANKKSYYNNELLGFVDSTRNMNYFIKFIENYNPLLVIDPFSLIDLNNYAALHDRTGEMCLISLSNNIINDAHHARKLLNKNYCSVVLMRLTNYKTLSEFLSLWQQVNDAGFKIMLETDVKDYILLELCTSLDPQFIKYSEYAIANRTTLNKTSQKVDYINLANSL